MSSSETFQAGRREKVGSRAARALRAQGRIPCAIQHDGPHLDIHIDEVQFLASRRHHVHLFDLDVEGQMETAVIRELQWDAFGDRIVHVEFKRVQRGVKTEAEVEITFTGHPKGGVINHIHSHVTVLALPSEIPDEIEVKLAGYDEGDSIHAYDLVLSEGIELAVEPDLLIATLSSARASAIEEAVEEGAEEEAAAGEAAPEPTETDRDKDKDRDRDRDRDKE